MYETMITVCGNVLNQPEWRRTTTTGAIVVSFKVASTARRYSREAGEWVDGNSLRVRVTCWRRLAEGVGASVKCGDPVIVIGRLYTREWEDDAGNKRLSYELEAVAVGHDLAKGRAQFARIKVAPGTSMVDDAEAEARAGGEITSAISPDEIPVPPPGDLDIDELDVPEWQTFDPVASLRASGQEPVRLDGDVASGSATGGPGVGPNGSSAGAVPGGSWPAEGWSAGAASTVDAPPGDDDPEPTDESDAGGTSRRRRGRNRVAVPV